MDDEPVKDCFDDELGSLSRLFNALSEVPTVSECYVSVGYCTGGCAINAYTPKLKLVFKSARKSRPFQCPDCSYALYWRLLPLDRLPKIAMDLK